MSLNDAFLSFLNEKIHFENFRFSARKWLSPMGEKFRIFAKDLNHPKIIVFGNFEPTWHIFIIFEWKNPLWKFLIFSSKMTLSPMGEKFRIFAKDSNHPKFIVFGNFEPKWRIFIIFQLIKIRHLGLKIPNSMIFG